MRTEPLSPDSPILADRAASWTSAYVHVPFCARVCPYCDFAVVAGRDDLADRYSAALDAEIGRTPEWRALDALFVGGGTPSRFGPERLTALVTAIRRRFGLAAEGEVTLEANPEDWTVALAADLVDAGYNRVSFGAQSFDDEVLARLGRRHTPAQIEAAVEAARKAGLGSVSIDLIFGTPGETLQSWRRTVERAVSTGVDHVSTYALTVERGTPLGRSVASGAPGPDADLQADMYEVASELLTKAGLVRYEVSNWARPGHVCRYNHSVWAQGEYEAFGNGSHGYREGLRFNNVRRLDTYLERVASGRSPRQGGETISGWPAELDRLFVGLRRTAGVADGPGVTAFRASPGGRRLLDAGVVDYDDGRLQVVKPLLTDEAERVVLGLAAPAEATG